MIQSRHLGAEKLEDVPALINRCFEEYVIPLEFTLAILKEILRTDSVDIIESRIFSQDGQDVAIALVGRRGKVSRLGLMGIVKTHRGKGVGREVVSQLAQEARERGDDAMMLEVIQANTAAVRLYENAGFQVVGNLYGFSGRLLNHVEPRQFEDSSAKEMARAIAADSSAQFAWQIDFESVSQLATPWGFVRYGSAYAAYTAPQDREVLAVRAFVCEESLQGQEDAKTLLSSLDVRHPGRSWRFSPIYLSENLRAACHASGLTDDEVRQYRMELLLR